MSHPAGVGLWRITPKEETFPSWEVVERGHTAHDAWTRARARLPEFAFNDCLFELVNDVAPPEAARSTACSTASEEAA